MINFATLQGLTIPEGVVTQIADASGRVIWAVSGGKVVLEVEKITSNTYASETTYTGESFILLNIYPKTNGTVSVTYGGLTKTITDTSGAVTPNAQQVFFGTFNGVSDSVTTPVSGELTIEGDCRCFSVGSYSSSKSATAYCGCITAVKSFGTIEEFVSNNFRGCTALTSVTIPDKINTIMSSNFYGCTGLKSVTLPSNLINLGSSLFDDGVFNGCTGLTSVTIPHKVSNIGLKCFYGCSNLTEIIFLCTTPPTLYDDMALYGSYPIIVPAGCGDAYKAEQYWANVAGRIVEAS